MLLALLFSLSAVLNRVDAVYFYVKQGGVRCFVEEVPEDTLVVGHYESLDHQPTWRSSEDQKEADVGIFISVEEPISKAEVLKEWTSKEGKFVFTSSSGGEHRICIGAVGPSWYGSEVKHRFQLHMEVGEAAVDYDEIAKAEHLSAIEVEVRRLSDKLKSVRAEQAYQKEREISFRDTSESTNSRVMWWSILQTLVLIGSAVYQIQHLKMFFRKKKVV